eukprot:14705013-Heterocapsa_arctica.AAC.1
MGGFWKNCGCRKWGRIVFKSLVSSTLHSCLAAFALAPSECNALDMVLLPLARQVLQGDACTRENDGQAHRKALSNTMVLKLLKAVPTEIELRVQRLQWWQTIVSFPGDFVQLLAVWF